MKLIVRHQKTRAKLEHWAGDKCLVTSDHYFWSTGDELQRSLEGLHRSILFDILRQCPSLIPAVFAEQWAALRSDTQRSPGSQGPIDIEESLFRTSKIKDAFERLVTEQLDDQYCICLFVDGLDEFQGDPFEHRQLAESFSRWSARPNVKCLLSSRPYPEFHKPFPEETRLHLHRLNERDIYLFSLHMFERDSNIEPIRFFYKRLVYKVVQDSEGVFLWAVLVVRILLGSASYDSENILFQKMRSLPKELEKVYQTLLKSLEPLDRQRASKMLFLALSDTQLDLHMSTLAYSWLDVLEDPTFPFAKTCRKTIDELTDQCNSGEQQIAFLTRGLLEISPIQAHIKRKDPKPLTKGVRFLHRTVADFLKDGGVLTCESTFNLSDSIWRLSLAEIVVFEDANCDGELIFEIMFKLFDLGERPVQIDQPSHDFLKRLEAEMPVSPPPVSQHITSWHFHADFETFTGQTMSVPHFLLFKGHADYVLSQSLSRPRTASAVSDLNLLLVWVARDSPSSPDITQQLLSKGFHFRDKVKLYPAVAKDQVGDNEGFAITHSIGTVWIIFVAMLWSIIANSLSVETPEDLDMPLVEFVKEMLGSLAVFMDKGADPDVVISFRSTSVWDKVYYTSLVETIRAVRQIFPTLIDIQGLPWKRVLSGQDSTSRTLPSWARRIPGADSQIEMVQDLRGMVSPEHDLTPTYFCSREECISAELKFRVC